MTRAKTYHWQETVILILSIALLGVVVYGEVLRFAFWKDDWAYFWCAVVRAVNVPVCPIWLHPGTNAEFYVLGHLVGKTYWAWQAVGIILRIAAAIGVAFLTRTLTRSRLAGWVSGLLYVTTPVAAETVGWASVHVINFVVASSTLGVLCWVQMLEHRSRRMAFFAVFALFVSFAADPLRLIPMVVLFLFLERTYHGAWQAMVPRRVVWTFLIIGFLGLVSFVIWQRAILFDTQIVRVALIYSPADVLRHAYVFGNYFTSLLHIILGSVAILPHETVEMSHGFPDTRQAFMGLLLLLSAFWWAIRMRERKKSYSQPLFVFLLWITLFYVPAWLFEPRLVATGVHRYLAMPAVGWYGLIGWIVSRMGRFRTVAVAIVVILLFRQVSVVQAYIRQVLPYRNAAIVEGVWESVDRIVGKDVLPTVFVYIGEEPMKTNVFDISGSMPFTVRRNLGLPSESPLVTHEQSRILKKLCQLGGSSAISTIYRFSVDNAGRVVDQSDMLRAQMSTLIDEGNCEGHGTIGI